MTLNHGHDEKHENAAHELKIYAPLELEIHAFSIIFQSFRIRSILNRPRFITREDERRPD